MSDYHWMALGIMVLGALATYAPRALGVLLSGRIDPRSRAFEWVACLTYAMLAGLISRMIVLPLGALAETHLIERLGATAIGVAVFFLAGRNLLAGVASGVCVIIAIAVLRGAGG